MNQTNTRKRYTQPCVGNKEVKLTTAQIGRCGELLCQFRLLQMGIESAPMTTDTGIDLVAYSNKQSDSFTIQVKTCLDSKPGGGKGRMLLDWWIPEGCRADYVSLVDMATTRVWLFTMVEIANVAQQKPKGRFHFFMMTDAHAPQRRDGKLQHDYDFQRYLIENSVPRNGL